MSLPIEPMNIHEFLPPPSETSRREGPHNRIVLSSRVRLARNLKGLAFPGWAKKVERIKTLELIRPAVEALLLQDTYVDNGTTGGKPYNSNFGSAMDLRVFKGNGKVARAFLKFLSDEKGATAIEYGLLTAGISIAIIAAVNGLGSNLNDKFTSLNTSLK